jgi:hypothetical protein
MRSSDPHQRKGALILLRNRSVPETFPVELFVSKAQVCLVLHEFYFAVLNTVSTKYLLSAFPLSQAVPHDYFLLK